MSDVKTVREHLRDLKRVLFRVFVFGFVLFFALFLASEKIIIFLIEYLSLNLSSLGPTEYMRTQLMLSLYLTLALLIPFVLVQVYYFSKPLFEKKSSKKVFVYFFNSVILAIIGFLFGVFFFSKYSLDFFLHLPEGVSAVWGVYSTMMFIMLSGFAFALTAQLIVIIPLLVKLELLDLAVLKKSRAFVIVFALTISAILTSPDPFTQILMSVPMYFCFEAGILISVFQRRLS